MPSVSFCLFSLFFFTDGKQKFSRAHGRAVLSLADDRPYAVAQKRPVLRSSVQEVHVLLLA